MKKLEDGTIRIEFEDKKKAEYFYKDITKEILQEIKKNKSTVSVFSANNKPDLKEVDDGYIENAYYDEEGLLPSLIVSKYIIKNGRMHKDFVSVVTL